MTSDTRQPFAYDPNVIYLPDRPVEFYWPDADKGPQPARPRQVEPAPAEQVVRDATALPSGWLTPEERRILRPDESSRLVMPDGILDVGPDRPRIIRPDSPEAASLRAEGAPRLPEAVTPEVAARILEQARIRRQTEAAKEAFLANERGQGRSEEAAKAALAKAEADGSFRRFAEEFYSRRGIRPPTMVDVPSAIAEVNAIDPLARRVNTRIEVYDNVAAMPQGYRYAFAGGDTKATTFTAQNGQKVVVVDRSMHADPADLRKTLNHEIVGHAALPEILGSAAYGDLLNQVARLRAEDSSVAQVFREVAALYPGADPRLLNAEVLARVAEDGTLPPKGAVAAIRDRFLKAMRAAGLRGSREGILTAEQLKAILGSVRNSSNNPEAALALRMATVPLGDARLGQQFEWTSTGARRDMFMRAASFLWNESAPVIEAAKALRDLRGVNSGIIDQLYQAPNRIHTTYDRFSARHIDPINREMKAIADEFGLSLDQVGVLADHVSAVKHGYERNDATWLLFAKVDAATEATRAQLIADFRDGKITGDVLRNNLRSIVTNQTTRTPRAEWRGYGATDAELNTLAATLANNPAAQAVERRLWPMMRSFIDDLADHQLKSGLLTRPEMDLYGFKNYVPARGGEGRSNLLVINSIAGNYVTSRKAEGRGGQGIPEHVIGELLDSAAETARAYGNRELFRALGEAIADDVARVQNTKQTPLLGQEVAAKNTISTTKSGVIQFNIPQGIHPDEYKNVFRYIDSNGDLRFLAITDPTLSKALNAVAAGPPHVGGIRAAAQSVTGLQGRLFTSLNPFFWSTQIARDIIGNSARLMTDTQALGLPASKAATMPAAFIARFGKEMTPGSLTWRYAVENHDRAAQLRLIDQWKNSGDPRTVEFAEFLESGMIRFSSQFSATSEFRGTPLANSVLGRNNAVRQGYDRLFGSDGWIKNLVERMQSIQEALELAHRWSFYRTLRENGVAPDRARSETIQLTNFNQRSEVSRILNPFYAFSHTITAGADRAFNRGIWKNGEVPWQRTELPDGTYIRTLSLRDVAANLNYARLGYVTALGYAFTSLAASLLGNMKDSQGVSVFDKLSPESRMRSLFVPGFRSGEVLRIPLPDTEAAFGFALGAALHGLQNGLMTQDEAKVGLLNNAQRVFGPALKPRTDIPDGERGNVLASALLGAVPTVLRPLAEGAFNLNFAGNPLDRRGQTVSGPGGQVRLSGVEATRETINPAWRRIAEAVRDATGGPGQGVNVSGDVLRNVVTTYLGPVARIWDGVAQAEHQARREGRAEQFDPIRKIVEDLFVKQENSYKTYYFREHEQARAPLETLRNAYAAAIQRDRDADESRKSRAPDRSGRNRLQWTVGPRQQQFLDENPVMRDYIDYLMNRQRETQRDAQQAGGSAFQRSRTARATGDAAAIIEDRQRTEERLGREARLFKNLWRAHYEWQAAGSNPARWAEFRDRYVRPTDLTPGSPP